MATKELTARVKLDITDAERRLKSLTSLIKDIDRVITKSSSNKGLEQQMDRAAISAEKVKQATLRTKIAEEQLAQAKLKTNMLSEQSALKSLLAEEKLNQAINQGQQNEEKLAQIKAKSALAEEKIAQQQVKAQQAKEAQLAKEEAWVDRVIQKEMDEVHRKQQAQWKAFQAEQAAYEKNVVQVEQRKQQELEIERVRQQSLNTMTQADRAAQRLNRTQYEQWWHASMTRQEWANAHPILSRLSNGWNRVNQNVQRVLVTSPQLVSMHNRLTATTTNIVQKVREWWYNQNKVSSATRNTNSVLGSIFNKLKGIAATYLGIMGAKAILNTSDTITSAQNKLNYVSSQQLGAEKAITTDSSGKEIYSQATLDQTQEAMDKMYVSSQKVRMSYTDMMSNVSKAMTLAGKSFQGSTDNAIRFQEVMSEAYTIGGASAQEMSSSMYQMLQALGSGTLQGDELRSVREGAPLAYKAIEEFAQGVWNTTDSLKEMASEGKISSEMVVAAVMDMGDEIDKAFEKTDMTFAQMWTKIQNAAIKAFEPVSKALNKMLNTAVQNGAFEKIETAFFNISKVFQITFALISIGIQWIADNWNWLKQVIIVAVITIGVYLTYLATQSIIAAITSTVAWILLHWQLLLIVGAISLIIYMFYSLANASLVVGKLILTILSIIGIAMAVILFPKFIAWIKYLAFAIQYYVVLGAQALASGIKAMIGWIAANWILLLIIVVIGAVVAAVIWLADSFEDACGMIVGGIMAAISVVWNLFWTLLTMLLKSVLLPLTTAWDNFANFFGNLFNDPIAAIIHSFEKLGDMVLSILQTIAKGIDAVFGSNLSDTVQGWRDNLKNKAGELAEKYGNGTYEEKSKLSDWIDEQLSAGQDFMMWDTADAYNTGYKWGEAGGSWIKDKVSGLGDMLSLDGIGDKLGLDFGNQLDTTDPKYDVTGAYNMPSNDDLMKSVGNIDDNTKKTADSMDLENDDLDYLRKLAEMEWRNEFTTAEIKIDMTNNNTVNGERDLDGIVEYLSDVLRAEMTSVAYGVHY